MIQSIVAKVHGPHRLPLQQGLGKGAALTGRNGQAVKVVVEATPTPGYSDSVSRTLPTMLNHLSTRSNGLYSFVPFLKGEIREVKREYLSHPLSYRELLRK